LVEQKRFKARKNRIATRAQKKKQARRNASSSIRTVTVGSSIGLDLLTCETLAGFRSARGLAASV
jgi:hypothetical protein